VRSDRKVRRGTIVCGGTKTSMRSLSLFLRAYDHDEVAMRPKRRLCTTSGAREGSFGRFGEGHGGGGGKRTRGLRGDAYRIVASRSSHVRATATSRDRRRNRTATLRLCVHSCTVQLCSLSLSFSFSSLSRILLFL